MSKQLQYNKRCEIIKNLINEKYINDIFTFEIYDNVIGDFNEIKFFTRIVINNKETITILPNTTWKDIERNINFKLKNKDEKTKECPICLNNVSKYTSCNKCGNYWCIPCYIEIFKTGNGIIKCPFCRNSFGIYTPEYMIEICIQEIKMRAGL